MLLNKNGQVITALVTPFNQSGEIDFDSLEKLIEFQIAQKIDGLVVLGTTGEAATLSMHEKSSVIEFAAKIINKRTAMIVGTGSTCTKTSILNHQQVQDQGADASLIVTPYYNNPKSKSILEHYKKIDASSTLPFFLYHVPSRTHSKLTVNDAESILALDNCIGMKDATGSMEWLSLLNKQDKIMFSGDDFSSPYYHKLGGHGVISVLSNLTPKGMHALLINSDPWMSKLAKSIGCDTNPIPIKWMLKQVGLIKSDFVRLPLMQMDATGIEELAPYLLNKSLCP